MVILVRRSVTSGYDLTSHAGCGWDEGNLVLFRVGNPTNIWAENEFLPILSEIERVVSVVDFVRLSVGLVSACCLAVVSTVDFTGLGCHYVRNGHDLARG